MKLTPRDDESVYNQKLPMPIYLKEDLILERALMHKHRIIIVLPFPKYASYIFTKEETSGEQRPTVDLRKINTLFADDHTETNDLVSVFADAAEHLAGNFFSGSLIVFRLITICSGQTNSQWKCLQSFFLAELPPTKDLHKVSADLCLLFHVSCASTWIQFSKLANVFKMWMIMELHPTRLRI